ncbi:MAG: hypothetical protein V2A57_01830 [Elusimicrobiota bacterium]
MTHPFGGMFLYFIFTILVFVALFVILRHFVLWYWKINSIETLLEEIRDTLQNGGKPSTKTMECPFCNKFTQIDSTFCSHCGKNISKDI